MKANNGKGDVPERDRWATDDIFWNKLNSQYNFKFDCCASLENYKTDLFSNDFENVLVRVDCVAWMNPPFSNARDMFQHFFKVVSKGVAIYRFDNAETKIWQEIIFPNISWIFILKGRLAYKPFDIDIRKGLGTRFPSVLIGLNVDPPKNIKGVLLKVKDEM